MEQIGRYIVIGDVHGCLHELQELLQLCALREDDCLVYVGDLLDKGPMGPQTVLWVQQQAQQYKTIVLMGNHELKNLQRFQSFAKKLSKSPSAQLPVNEYTDNYFGLQSTGRQFLQSCQLYYRIPSTQFIAIHAGVTPKCTLPLSSTITDIRDINQSLLRVRFVRAEDELELTTTTKTIVAGTRVHTKETTSVGKVRKKHAMISLGEEWEAHRYWAHMYDGRLGHILFGHSAWKEEASAKIFAHASGLDLGCVYGGKLCAAIVTPNPADQNNAHISYVAVDALQTYTPTYKPTLFDEQGFFRKA